MNVLLENFPGSLELQLKNITGPVAKGASLCFHVGYIRLNRIKIDKWQVLRIKGGESTKSRQFR